MYHSHNSKSWGEVILKLVAAVLLLFGIMFTHNLCTADEWNGGVCPACHVRYDLGGVYKGREYWYCPDCGETVSRY